MKEYNTIETLRLYVMKAQTQKALDELYIFVRETKIVDLQDQIILLASNFRDIDRSANLGLGDYQEEKNRINLTLLKILTNLEKDERIKIKTNIEKSRVERLEAIESKLDFLLNHIEKNDDLLFYGFHKSALWNSLEESTREKITQANIIETEGNQDRYKMAMYLLAEAITIELETKFFAKFKAKITNQLDNRNEFMDALEGMNKDSFYTYLKGAGDLSLHQMAEILLQNIFLVDKEKMSSLAELLYDTFYHQFKIKNNAMVVGFFQKQLAIKYERVIRGFTQTLIDVVELKEDVIHLFLNLQPRKK